MNESEAVAPELRLRVQSGMRSALRVELGMPGAGPRPRVETGDLHWAFRMGLQPLFSGQEQALDLAPEGLEMLRRRQRLEMLQQLRQAHSSWSLQQAFLEEGILTLVYKGTALSLLTTRSLTGRPPGDVDLLIRRSDVARANEMLTERGWVPDPIKLPAFGQRGWWVTQRLTCETTYRGVGPSVDLHWRLDPTWRNYRASFEELWERRQTVSGGGVDLLTLGEADSLLLTAVHGTRERWMFGRQVVDATRQLAARSGSWDELLGLASDVGAKRSLALAVGMARRTLGLDPVIRHVRYERLLDSAQSHRVVGGDLGLASTPRGVLQGQRWRWQTADTPLAAATAFFSPGLRHVLSAMTYSRGR